MSPTASMISWSVAMMVIKVRVRVTVRLTWTMVSRMDYLGQIINFRQKLRVSLDTDIFKTNPELDLIKIEILSLKKNIFNFSKTINMLTNVIKTWPIQDFVEFFFFLCFQITLSLSLVNS